MNHTSDNDLLLGSRTDPAQFAELYRRHIDHLIGFVARRTNRAADVADVVSSTFMIALETRAAFDPHKGDALPWLYGIARRLMANQRRRFGREKDATSRLRARRLIDNDDLERLEERIDVERASPRLQQSLAHVKPLHREALLLVGPDKLSVADAANVLGIPPAAFRVRLSRARKALRQAMGDAERAESSALFPKNKTAHYGVTEQ